MIQIFNNSHIFKLYLIIFVSLIDNIFKKNKYDLYLFDIDIPWVNDDLRDRPNDRKLFLENFKETLIKNHKPFKLISGNFNERLKKYINFVDDILLRKT